MSPDAAGVSVRRANDDDRPQILALASRSLGWELGDATERHFHWKHAENPFGASPMWVAEVDGQLAGFRAFLRWNFRTGSGELRRAVRAVDTATDPDFQGRGVFTQLTLGALDELRADGIDFVFNTPNAQSRPGYLKMGWEVAGRLPVGVRLTRWSSVAQVLRARVPATRGALPSDAGVPAPDLLGDPDLAASLATRATHPTAPSVLTTDRTPAYLAWRYGPEALHYRAVAGPRGPAAGIGVFHLRRRGPATEAVLCDLLVPPDDHTTRRAVLRAIVRSAGASYVVCLTPRAVGPHRGFVRLPAAGPTLTSRAVCRPAEATRDAWALTMGDIELF